MGILVPIFVITIPLVFAVFVIFFKNQEKSQRNKLLAELYAKAIEKGEKLPENLFEEPKKKGNSLKVAIILISVAIGIVLCASFVDDVPYKEAIAAGVIPFTLGLGFLVIHYLGKKQIVSDDE